MRFQQKNSRLILINAFIDPIPLAGFQRLKMLNFLYSKDMSRQFLRLFQILTFQKQLQKLAIIILPADSAVLELNNQRCILNNTSYYVIRDFQNFFALTFVSLRIYKPVFQRIPFAHHIFTNTRLRIPMKLQNRMWNVQFTLYHSFQNILFNYGHIICQNLLNPLGMALQFLHKFIQILNKLVLMYNKFH